MQRNVSSFDVWTCFVSYFMLVFLRIKLNENTSYNEHKFHEQFIQIKGITALFNKVPIQILRFDKQALGIALGEN